MKIRSTMPSRMLPECSLAPLSTWFGFQPTCANHHWVVSPLFTTRLAEYKLEICMCACLKGFWKINSHFKGKHLSALLRNWEYVFIGMHRWYRCMNQSVGWSVCVCVWGVVIQKHLAFLHYSLGNEPQSQPSHQD